jgi:hypothetical protein
LSVVHCDGWDGVQTPTVLLRAAMQQQQQQQLLGLLSKDIYSV